MSKGWTTQHTHSTHTAHTEERKGCGSHSRPHCVQQIHTHMQAKGAHHMLFQGVLVDLVCGGGGGGGRLRAPAATTHASAQSFFFSFCVCVCVCARVRVCLLLCFSDAFNTQAHTRERRERKEREEKREERGRTGCGATTCVSLRFTCFVVCCLPSSSLLLPGGCFRDSFLCRTTQRRFLDEWRQAEVSYLLW